MEKNDNKPCLHQRQLINTEEHNHKLTKMVNLSMNNNQEIQYPHS